MSQQTTLPVVTCLPSVTIAGDLGTAFDEPRVCALLGGDDEQITLALALIDRHLRHTMDLWLRRHMRMRPEDRADVWAETLLAVLKAARRHRFDSSRPLLPWLRRILRNTAIGHLRRRASWQRLLKSCPPQAAATDAIPAIEQDESATGLRALIDAFVATLPVSQRIALTVYLKSWPENRPAKILQHKVSEQTGRAVTLEAVKQAMLVGRGKLRRFLRECGYAVGPKWTRQLEEDVRQPRRVTS